MMTVYIDPRQMKKCIICDGDQVQLQQQMQDKDCTQHGSSSLMTNEPDASVLYQTVGDTGIPQYCCSTTIFSELINYRFEVVVSL